MKLSRVGVDLAKNVFQLHGVDRSGKTARMAWAMLQNGTDYDPALAIS